MAQNAFSLSSRRSLMSLAVAIFFLVGCGSDPQTSEAATAAEPTTVGAEETPADEPDEGSDSPIDQMLGVPIMDEAAMNDYAIDLLIEGERETATCMIAEGFEYTPVIPAGTSLSAQDGTSGRELAEKQGFGIVDSFIAATWDGASRTEDRNAIYLASLTDAEREAYTVALYGSPLDEQSDGAPGEGEDGQGEDSGFGIGLDGCKALAAESLIGLFNVLEQFDAPATAIFEQFDADPRMQESRDIWTRCMAEKGYTASHPEEVRELVYEMLIPIIDNDAAYDVSPGLEEPEDLEFAELADWSFLLSGDSFSAHPPLTTEAQGRVDEVADFEKKLAVTHFDCHEPLKDNELAIQREYEQQLVDELGPAVQQALEDD